MNFPRFPSKTYRRRIEGWGKHGEGESKARVSIVSIAASRMRTLEQEEGRPASGPGVSGACVSGGMGTRQEGMSSWRNACLSLELFFILVAGTDMLPDSAMETGKTVFTDGYHRSSMRMQGIFTYNSGQPLLVTQGGLHRGCGLVFTEDKKKGQE